MDKFAALSQMFAPCRTVDVLAKNSQLGRTFMALVEHDLPDDGFIPAERAVLGWDSVKTRDGHFLSCNFTVFYWPEGLFEDPCHAHAKRRWSECANMFSMAGATDSGWMKHPMANPSRAYGNVVAQGFIDEGEAMRALGQMATIRECQWARDMLAGIAPYVVDLDDEMAPPFENRRVVEEITEMLIDHHAPVNPEDLQRQIDVATTRILRRRAVRAGEEDEFIV